MVTRTPVGTTDARSSSGLLSRSRRRLADISSSTHPGTRAQDDQELMTQLEHYHEQLDASLRRLVDFAHASDYPLLEEEWDAFEKHALTHIDTEEVLLLPPFAEEHPVAATAIRNAHIDIRRMLGTSGSRSTSTSCAEDVDELQQRLAANGDVEMQSLFPWARADAENEELRLRLPEVDSDPQARAKAMAAVVEVVQACENGERGYRIAASNVPDHRYRLRFTAYADDRERFAMQLDHELRTLGVTQPRREGSAAGTFHRGWFDAPRRSRRDRLEVALQECRRGDRAALRSTARHSGRSCRSPCGSHGEPVPGSEEGIRRAPAPPVRVPES